MVFAGASILVATDPDNTRVAAWNTTTGELITELEPLDLAVNGLAAGVLPNGRTIAVAAGANGIGRWDVHTGKALASLSDDAYWSVATNGKAIDRWDLSTGESIGRPTLFTTASEEMLLRRWDALTGEPIGDP